MRFVRVSLAAAALAAIVAGTGDARADGDAAKGKIAFTQHGCWQCHDFAGEGSVATSNGKVIARTQLPLDAFISFVRTTDGQMPPFRAAILSDQDLTNIYAYLQSLPAPKAVSDIPLLNSGVRSQ
ncbi:MAG TPA: cytochrome c [Xanthobacteraceae bacterium]|nr:cytochrome c [Xanthobacteraceae bacterium]